MLAGLNNGLKQDRIQLRIDVKTVLGFRHRIDELYALEAVTIRLSEKVQLL